MNQNRLYWAYLHELSAETGNDAEDLHEYFKRKFLPPRFLKVALSKRNAVGTPTGPVSVDEIKLPATTTTLSIADFSNYIMRIEAHTGYAVPQLE